MNINNNYNFNHLILFSLRGDFYKALKDPTRLYRDMINFSNLLPESSALLNLWKLYVSYSLINHMNAYSLRRERVDDPAYDSLCKLALLDAQIYFQLINIDLSEIFNDLGSRYIEIIERFEIKSALNASIPYPCFNALINISNSCSPDALLNNLNEFYHRYGVGTLGLYHIFTAGTDKYNTLSLTPAFNTAHENIVSIIGADLQKEALLKNTEAFINNRFANHVLLYGDAGTGKSTCVKALPQLFGKDGLRLIGVSKENTFLLPSLAKQLAQRNYKFIIFLDDISFEENETGYKTLKSMIEGDTQKLPPNVLIYATSNRRHLIKENFSERLDGTSDEIHVSDSMEEKLSLSSRFGIKIRFDKPSQKEFEQIVRAIAGEYGLDGNNEELLTRAKSWEIAHGGRSGRNARQFLAQAGIN